MSQKAEYKTRQREAIVSYLSSLDDAHVTASEIAKHFSQAGIRMGLATIYRNLDRLVEEGVVKRIVVDQSAGACYQYAGKSEACAHHLHIKCERCGKIFHLDCHMVQELQTHVNHKHHFQIDLVKSVLYGICQHCAE